MTNVSDRRHLTPVPDDAATRDLTPPHDLDAERAVLGALLTGNRTALADVTTTITPADHYRPGHELIHDAIEHLYSRGEPVDPITVGDQLHRTQQLDRAGGRSHLADLHINAPVPETAGHHARIVSEHAARRRLLAVATTLRATALTPGDLDLPDAIARAGTDLEHVPPRIPGVESEHPPPGLDIDTFLGAGDGDQYDWLLEGILERQDRLILTAGEGHGKSTLLRQIAVQSAAGIHPFTLGQIPAVKVLLIDLENSARQTRRKVRGLRVSAGPNLDPANLIIECRTEGLDLTTPEDQVWLNGILEHHQPDLLITGPIYKMAGGNPNDEKDAKPAAMYLDRMRAVHDVALLLEAHSRKAEGGDPRKRPKEPFGWSGWMRWPEFGLHLAEDGTLTHWRGMRDERDFPGHLNRGGQWPFIPGVTISDQRWTWIKDACRGAGRRLPVRALSEATGISRSEVQRILDERRVELAWLDRELDEVTGDES